jgi:hypothetical protein
MALTKNSKKNAKVAEEAPAAESPTRVSRRSAPSQAAKKASPSPSPAPKTLKKKGKFFRLVKF